MNQNSIESLINLPQQQTDLGFSVPTQIDFNLNKQDLNKLNSKRKGFQRFILPKELEADFRYYSLLLNNHGTVSPLTFTTYYLEKKQKTAVIKSTITVEGKISQQVCGHFLKDTQLLNKLVKNHYWLIDKICDRLKLKYNNKNQLLSKILSAILTIIIAPFLFYLLSWSWLVKLILLGVILALLYVVLRYAIANILPTLILNQLLLGFFAKNTSRRHIGFQLLRYFPRF